MCKSPKEQKRSRKGVRLGLHFMVNTAFPLACLSGEWATTSTLVGYYALAFDLGIVSALIFLSLHQRNVTWVPFYALLLLLNPAWTMDVGGDCGLAKRFFSVAVSLIFVALLIYHISSPRLGRRRFVLILCFVSWAAYFIVWPSHRMPFVLPLGSADGGLIDQALASLVAAGPYFFRVAFALTVVSFSLWRVECWRRMRSRSEKTIEGGATDYRITFESQPHAPVRTSLRIVSIAALLFLITWVMLYSTSPYSGPFTRNFLSETLLDSRATFTAFAFAWSAILIIAAVRGRFPGWDTRQS